MKKTLLFATYVSLLSVTECFAANGVAESDFFTINTMVFRAPTNLQATQYHNQHPQGVKLTWSPVDGAPGYVVVRKMVGGDTFYPIATRTTTEYLDNVATMPNVKDFKAQYAVAVADWQGNDPNTLVYLSPWSKAEWGCWRENPPPTVEHRPPRVVGMTKSNTNPMLSGVKGENVYTLEFNDDYDKSGYVFKQAKITGVHNGKRQDFPSSTRSVTVDIPAGEHGKWSFEVRGIFTETASGKEYTTEPPFRLDNERVCFIRTGRDGVRVNGTEVWGNKEAPNWFKYWKRDGALSLLHEEGIYYDSLPWWDPITTYSSVGKAGAATSPLTGDIYIRDRALSDEYSSYIMNNGQRVTLHTANASSLLKCAEVLTHELGHRELWNLRGKKSGLIYWRFSGQDKDKDGLPDYIENTCSFLPFSDNNCDTFGFMRQFAGVYSEEKADEEVYVRYLATHENNKEFFNRVVKEANDFSWESSDKPSKKMMTRLSATPSSLHTTSSEVLLSGLLANRDFFGDEQFVAYDNSIEINGVNSLVPIVLNVDSFDGLHIEISCSASTSMPCVVVATLVAENGEPVAWASRTGYVDEGENDVTLKVDGSVLRESGKNGYTVASVSVFDIRSIELMEPIAYAAVNFESPTRYKWSDFRTDNVTIQSLALTEDDGCVKVDAEIVVPNEDGVYELSSYLCDAGTRDYVAEASQTNVVLRAGTNAVSLAFANSDIQMNAVSNAFAVSKFTVEKDGEIVAAYSGDAMLNVEDETILTPTNAVLTFDSSTVSNELVAAEGSALYSGVNFAFDVENSHANEVAYTLTAYLNSTNSLTVNMATFDLSLTSGVNRITIPFLGAQIRESGIDGPYVLSSVRLESKDETIASQTLRMDSRTEDCAADDFQGTIITRLVGISRKYNSDDSIVVRIAFETAGAVPGIVNASLVDSENKVVMFGSADFEADCAGVKSVEVCFAVSNITESACTMPLRVAYISIDPTDKLLPGLSDDTFELTIAELDYLEPTATPVISPATKTVFFGREQTIVISCATDAAEIRYTLDGSDPTDASLLYEGAFTISSNTTVKAKAFAANMRPSETVQAEYIHASIVGDNLVQCTAPEIGVAQTVSVPVPGTYQVSFDWTQGGDIELRMAQNGITNSIAVIAAAVSGTTNFLYDISSAGNYELILFDLSSCISQPAEVANLNIAIPSTPENRQRFWIYETESTYCSTGEWIPDKGFVGGKMPIEFESLFLPNTVSDGGLVTIISTVECRTIELEVNADEIPESKAAISICVDETGANVFRVLTIKDDGSNVWKTVSADGREYPEAGVAYTFRTVLDLTNRTYSVAIVDGDTEFLLGDEEGSTFAFANDSRLGVEQVRVWGRCEISSLYGECDNLSLEFVRGDKVHLINGTESSCITEGQAAWLNSMGAYDVVKAKVADMDDEGLSIAYLLNLDLTKDGFGLVSFSVSGIEVTETEVRINVNLSREGAVQVQGSSGMRDAPINGILKLYGGETPQAKSLLNATIVTGESFGEGDTATFVYPRSGNAKFFRPIIDMP